MKHFRVVKRDGEPYTIQTHGFFGWHNHRVFDFPTLTRTGVMSTKLLTFDSASDAVAEMNKLFEYFNTPRVKAGKKELREIASTSWTDYAGP